jgi:predicted 3-demethylubiquinone-9 3-methyltransferase (glyoxalase superfamily)
MEEESLLLCPYCDEELALPEEMVQFAGRYIRSVNRRFACDNCGQGLDLQAQLAYERGRVAFSTGQDLLNSLSPRKRKKDFNTEQEKEAIQLYISAYTGLQEAFQGELTEDQRRLGIRMMTAMANQFTLHNMVSPLEAGYWAALLVEVNTQTEIESLEQKLNGDGKKKVTGWLNRFRWKIRLRQLKKELVGLDHKIQVIEQNIAFVDPPRTRKSHTRKHSLHYR